MFPFLADAADRLDDALRSGDSYEICTATRMLYLEFGRAYDRWPQSISREFALRVEAQFAKAVEILQTDRAADAKYLQNVRERLSEMRETLDNIKAGIIPKPAPV